ncbi:alpha/beta fold hydrolase [Actinotalea solisilvae]|uniref:alpha/beta fold hydrolase n=1 Tax=Actinotalea solisilvae TaxID=2072922 RepID=UPI0027DC6F9E|nr:alpha/beta hydrolase [Actinotalea solisilvae]
MPPAERGPAAAATATLRASDGTLLAVHERGTGEPLLCLPGGPMRASRYLGDLGGLTAQRRLLLLDLRGTGDSAPSADASGYRADRLVDDVEALRVDRGLDRMDVLGHSAGATLALLWATRHPERVRRLVLVTPSLRAVGIEVSDADRRATADRRAGEPWFAAASAALDAVASGRGTPEDEEAVTPFFYGRWDDAARRHHEAGADERDDALSRAFADPGALDPDGTRAALASLDAPVLVLAGAEDVNSPPQRLALLADLARHGSLHVLARAGHYPWLDDPGAFTRVVGGFVAGQDPEAPGRSPVTSS